MGIMITYGSYVKPEVNLNKAVKQIEFFDSGVALVAGAMIIPAVYVFSGTEGMSAGPSLMFISLPKVFSAQWFCWTAARYHGLYQQQRHDAIYRTALHDSGWVDCNT